METQENKDNINSFISSTMKDASSWGNLLAETISLFRCVSGTLHQLDEKNQTLVLKAQRGIPEKLHTIISNIPVGKGMAGIAAERKEAVQVCNLQTDDSGVVRPGAKDTKVEGAITVPLLFEGKLYGTLGIAKSTEYTFTDEEVQSLMKIAGSIAGMMAN